MSHDVIAQKYTRKQRYLLPWVKVSEKKMLKSGTAVFTFSEKDCKLLNELYDVKSRSTFFFLKQEVVSARLLKESDYFVMFGSWGRPENYLALQWFIDSVVPLLTRPIKIKVIGGGEMPESILAQIKTCGIFEYIGFVDNPYNIIANAIAEIAPLRQGAGVKVKCVEALACGTPIIGTPVAFEGIPCYEGMEKMMIKAETPEEYVHYIETKQMPLDERVTMKEIFCKNYSDSAIVKYLLSL